MKTLSYLKAKRGHFTNEQNLFLIDCDSGQPLLSSTFTVSLVKIKKPLNSNFFNEKYRDDWYEIIDVGSSFKTFNKEKIVFNLSIFWNNLFVNSMKFIVNAYYLVY